MKELWTPRTQSLTESAMAKLMNRQGDFKSYADYHQWSTQKFEDFWKSLLWESNLLFVGTPETVYVPNKDGAFWGGSWFPDIQLNYTQNLISNASKEPVWGILEDGTKTVYSKKRLLDQVKAVQGYLIQKGVKKGDCVAGFVANVPEAVVAMLAATSLGAIWSSCSPDFGHKGVLDRFSQISPKILFVVDGYIYNQKKILMPEKNKALTDSLKSLVDVVEIGVLNKNSSKFLDICNNFKSDEPLEFEQCEFSDPLFIMFSSGTTGAPKALVHTVGGTLVQHYKEHKLHCDLQENEKILYYTTCGWMMWNWLVSSMVCGATVVCFDGSPMSPERDSLWKLVKKESIQVFGTSAKFIGSCRQSDLDLTNLELSKSTRLVLSTGSPLLPEDFDYFYSKVDQTHEIQLSSICGGTDIISCFMLGNPLSPVFRSQIQGPGLGMDIAAFDENGNSVLAEKGELVCLKPFPSMPSGFLNDLDNKKFQSAYFERFPGVWHHGDYVSFEKEGGVVVYGRSDATLNPGGVRIGSAEIYRVVESLDEILDSLVTGFGSSGDEAVVLFVKLKEGVVLTTELKEKIKAAIKISASPRHVPQFVFSVSEIPYTISGKKVELAVKKLLAGEEPKNVDALANPGSLEIFRNLRLELLKG